MNRWLGLALLALFTLLAACSKPVPPQLAPKGVRVAAVSPAGLDVVITVTATNPNAFDLTAQSFAGKAKVAGKYDLGTVTVTKPVTLPSKQATDIDVPMTLPWTNLAAMAELAQARAPVPYTVDGTATIGGKSLNADVPFSISGTITPQQFQAAVLKNIPAIPGLTIPAHP